MAETYHSKNGKFCKKDNAHKVNKGGKQYRVVRQHRRIGPNGKEVRISKSKRKQTDEAIQHGLAARQRLALLGRLTGPGWVNMSEAFKK